LSQQQQQQQQQQTDVPQLDFVSRQRYVKEKGFDPF
jgi:hypothetical protein